MITRQIHFHPDFGTAPPSIKAPARDERLWYACTTRSRHEKKVARLLHRGGIECYLPLATRRSVWKDRVKRVELPLFPGYVFGRVAREGLNSLLATSGVVSLVGGARSPRPVPADEIQSLRLLLDAAGRESLEIHPAAEVACGDRVEVATGPFAGVRGVVTERRGARRVLVGIGAIGQALEVDFPLGALRPILN